MDILGLIDIPLWCLLLLAFLVLLYVYGTWEHTLWVSQGIPGPKPWPLLGSQLQHMRESNFNVYTNWKNKYGRIYGAFFGAKPLLVVTDLDMIRDIYVKHANNFTDRFVTRGLRPGFIDKSLFFAVGTTWKRIRNLMTPSFSSSKLKLMTHFIKRCSDLLVKNMEKKAEAGELVDVKDVFGSFTMDVIAGTAFGVETNSQTQEGEPFVQQCKLIFKNPSFQVVQRMALYLSSAFPFMAKLMSFANVGFGSNTGFFFNALNAMVDERRKDNTTQSKKPPDMLQMLVDVESDPELVTDTADDTDDTKSNRRMTKEEILAQGFIVLIAGFETTATTLQYLTYCLSLNPDMQERLYQEIRDNLGDAAPTYENVSPLQYLDACLHETLRMFPPVGAVDRMALKPMTVRGVHIPAGCGVILPIYTILHDPEYFEDPDVFNPDRFLPENASKIHPVTVELPFGYGPRKCIGMRLALLEIKFAAVYMLRRIRFVKCPETPEKIKLGKAVGLAVPDSVIKVKAEVRSI